MEDNLTLQAYQDWLKQQQATQALQQSGDSLQQGLLGGQQETQPVAQPEQQQTAQQPTISDNTTQVQAQQPQVQQNQLNQQAAQQVLQQVSGGAANAAQAMQQEGQEGLQAGMQSAQNLANQRQQQQAEAESQASQALQKQQAQQEAGQKLIANLALSYLTGGLGSGGDAAAGAAEGSTKYFDMFRGGQGTFF